MIVDQGGSGLMERCELWRNAQGGVQVWGGGEITLDACTFRNHTAGGACGVHVRDGGTMEVEADCIFANNAGGDVVREKEEEDEGEEEEEEEEEEEAEEEEVDSHHLPQVEGV